jgi:hypothetical protein
VETVELFAVTGGGGSRYFCWAAGPGQARPATHIQSFRENASPSSRICITNLYVLYLYGKCSSIFFFSVLRFFLVDYRNMDVHCMYSLIDAEACSDWLLLCISSASKNNCKTDFSFRHKHSNKHLPWGTAFFILLPHQPLSNTLLWLACNAQDLAS